MQVHGLERQVIKEITVIGTSISITDSVKSHYFKVSEIKDLELKLF